MHNKLIISGIKWTSLSTLITSILHIVQLIILTKLLDATDFGLFAMVTVVVGFSQAFLDMGFTQSIIQKQSITNIEISTIYWLNILIGLFLYVIIVIIAPFISDFYNEPLLYKYTLISALALIILPFGQIFMAFKEKEMNFNFLAKLSVFTKFFAFFLTILLAYNGLKILALIYGVLFSYILQTIILFISSYKHIKINFDFNINSVKDHITFGKNITLTKILNYFYQQIDTILIGKFLGLEILGIYDLAKQLATKPSQIINYTAEKVFFPAMSKIQDNNESLKKMYLTLSKYMSFINFYIFSIIAIFSNEIITILYGDKWIEAAPIVALLAIYNAFRGIVNSSGSVLLAKAKTSLLFKWNLFTFIYILLIMLISTQYSIIYVSYSLIFFSLTLIIPNWYYLLKEPLKLNFSEYIKNIFKPFIIILIPSIISYILYIYMDKFLIFYILNLLLNISILITLLYIFEKDILKNGIKFLRKNNDK